MISAIIITKNEAKMLPSCLKTLKWVDEIIVVDAQSEDETVTLAKKFAAKIVTVPDGTDYSTSRNIGQKTATGDWLFYVDADERITSELKKEILSTICDLRSKIYSYKLSRQNIMLGQWLKHGGFWPDYVHRLFHKDALIKWTGKLHESPTVKGEIGTLTHPIKHYTARTIRMALAKSARWAPIEAQLLYQANSPQVIWWKLIKVFFQKLFSVWIIKAGFLDGTRGFILAFIQATHQMSVLTSLWELQQKD